MYKTSKYTSKVNNDLEIRTLDILAHSAEALSIQQIQQKDMILSGHTPQKIARVLGKLQEMNFVRKGKSRSTGRMMYKAVSVMLEQGYDMSIEEVAAVATPVMPEGNNWELTAERGLM